MKTPTKTTLTHRETVKRIETLIDACQAIANGLPSTDPLAKLASRQQRQLYAVVNAIQSNDKDELAHIDWTKKNAMEYISRPRWLAVYARDWDHAERRHKRNKAIRASYGLDDNDDPIRTPVKRRAKPNPVAIDDMLDDDEPIVDTTDNFTYPKG